MNRGVGDDGSLADLPWTAVFDPAANARALSAIQAQGFRAASQLVDRFVQIADSATNAGGNGQAATAEAPAEASVGPTSLPEGDAIMSSWWSLFGRMLRSMPGVTAARGGAASFDVGNENSSGLVHLHADGPGPVSTEVWLHNTGADDCGEVALRCSDLLAHDGRTIPAASVRFEPDRVPMPARSSRGLGVHVTVAETDPPGRYRGTLLASGHPDLWLPVLLTVRAPMTPET